MTDSKKPHTVGGAGPSVVNLADDTAGSSASTGENPYAAFQDLIAKAQTFARQLSAALYGIDAFSDEIAPTYHAPTLATLNRLSSMTHLGQAEAGRLIDVLEELEVATYRRGREVPHG